MCKFDVGIQIAFLVLLLCSVELLGGRSTKAEAALRAAVVVGTMAAATVSTWVAVGQPIGTFWRWLARSVDITVGYVAAMGAYYHAPWSGVSLLVAVVGPIVLLWPIVRQLRAPAAWAAILFITAVGALFAKQALTRHDPGHLVRAL